MNDPLYGMQKVTDDAFQVSNPSGNPLVDFFYFNVVTLATVGYGDISPVSALAKVICSMEILFAFIILTAILTTLIGRFQKIADQDDSERFVNK
jgi:voltage-gated potassium channel Kch